MKIARKEFRHPGWEFKNGWLDRFAKWWDDLWFLPPQDWVAPTLAEVRDDVMEFANKIGPEKLINICEYTSMKHKKGDDGVTHFVVWHWE